ncbi:MAG TPA: YcxB family protein [Blastocatellia bacterium]|nr:YcxB family protein [Blastocatellia bacterium]
MTPVKFQLSWQEYFAAERFLYQQNGTFSIPMIRRLRLKQRWNRKQVLRSEHIVEASHNGIHYVLDGIESELDWHYFQRWMENDQGFFLIYAQDVFNFIPKRAFANAAQQSEFRALLTSNLRQNSPFANQ